MSYSKSQRKTDFNTVHNIIESFEPVDKFLRIGPNEFDKRQKAVSDSLKNAGIDVGVVFSDEHYNGDVPYLGGNTNITVEQVAGIVGENGFHLMPASALPRSAAH